MGDVTVSRKQRLRTLEKEIREGMEEFYYTGMKLKEIRDDELYKEDGFKTWEDYCRKRWELGREQVRMLIIASEYREKLPSPSTAGSSWSHRAVVELTRIPDKRQAARVAERIVKEVEKSHKEAARNPDTKPLKLSSSTVRRFVDEDLGVDRAAKARETKQADKRPDLEVWLDQKTRAIEGILDALESVSEEGWKSLVRRSSDSVKRLTRACDALAAFLRKAGR